MASTLGHSLQEISRQSTTQQILPCAHTPCMCTTNKRFTNHPTFITCAGFWSMLLYNLIVLNAWVLHPWVGHHPRTNEILGPRRMATNPVWAACVKILICHIAGVNLINILAARMRGHLGHQPIVHTHTRSLLSRMSGAPESGQSTRWANRGPSSVCSG